jgi:hypothetical protein
MNKIKNFVVELWEDGFGFFVVVCGFLMAMYLAMVVACSFLNGVGV